MTGAQEFQSLFAQAIQDDRARTAEVVAGFRTLGYAAAHPDDGWVDREANRLFLAYPYFKAEFVGLGSTIALGDVHRGFRVVKVTRVEDTMFGLRYYHFRECES